MKWKRYLPLRVQRNVRGSSFFPRQGTVPQLTVCMPRHSVAPQGVMWTYFFWDPRADASTDTLQWAFESHFSCLAVPHPQLLYGRSKAWLHSVYNNCSTGIARTETPHVGLTMYLAQRVKDLPISIQPMLTVMLLKLWI